mmetsp:Transcript_8792/g.26681  ORF Transcript_8792/g.26681 Transcript_8792/m.26681 type:complete len:211 (-) Transcript_8792:773-1405(-)
MEHATARESHRTLEDSDVPAVAVSWTLYHSTDTSPLCLLWERPRRAGRLGQRQPCVHLALGVVLLHDALCKRGDVLRRAPGAPVAVNVEVVPDVMVVDRVLAKLKTLGADQVKQPCNHVADPARRWVPQRPHLSLVVRHNSLHHDGTAVAGRHRWRHLKPVADRVQHLLPALVAHVQVLRVRRHVDFLIWHAHVADLCGCGRVHVFFRNN